jgi:hypothetical protein
MIALTLFEISNQFQSLGLLAESDDLPAEVIADTLEALTGDFDVKAIQVAKFILSLEANADAVKEAAKATADRAARIQKRADSIRAYLQFHMEALQRPHIEDIEITLKLKKNPPAVVITDEHAIPAQFWVEPELPPKRLDKKAIKAAIQAGDRVDGAYIEAGERLDIRL